MQRLAFFVLAPVLIATLGASDAFPTRPADGTYVYAIAGTPALTSSTVVIRTDGWTVSTFEHALVAGTTIVTQTDYATSTLLPRHYRGGYGATVSVDMSFAGSTATVLTPPATFRASPGTATIVAGDGLIAYVAMLPSLLAAHPGTPISVVSLNENGKIVTIAGVPPAASRPPDVAATDIASAAVESSNGLRFDFWTDPRTHAVDAIDVAGLTVRLTSRTDATVAATPPPPAAVASPYPMAPARYAERDVSFASSGGAILAGTLSIPRRRGAKRLAAFAFVHGSGPGTRDGAVPQNPTFRELGNTLANAGYVVLRYDKRGIGKSTGTATESWKPLGDDARAAAAFLRAQPDVDPHRIFLLGHSEGGQIVPLIAPSIRPALAGIVMMAGPAIPMSRILDEQLPGAAPAARAKFDDAFRDYDGLDPAVSITKVAVPILVLQGSRDAQVLAKDLPPMVAAARAAKRKITVHVLDGDDHLFLRVPASQPADGSEYFVPAPLDPRVAQAILKWAAAIP